MDGKEGEEGLRLNQLPSKDSCFGFERWVCDMLHIAVLYFSVIYPNINIIVKQRSSCTIVEQLTVEMLIFAFSMLNI